MAVMFNHYVQNGTPFFREGNRAFILTRRKRTEIHTLCENINATDAAFGAPGMWNFRIVPDRQCGFLCLDVC